MSDPGNFRSFLLLQIYTTLLGHEILPKVLSTMMELPFASAVSSSLSASFGKPQSTTPSRGKKDVKFCFQLNILHDS